MAARAPFARLGDVSIVILAIAGSWFFAWQYLDLSRLSWWYDNTQHVRERTEGHKPDYDIMTLPWKPVSPRLFDVKPGGMTMVTNDEPFTYQALATINTGGAKVVDLRFDVDVEVGGVAIGLLQAGEWIAMNSRAKTGTFADVNWAQLGYQRSLTVVIANDNPAGESRLTVKSLQLFLRR